MLKYNGLEACIESSSGHHRLKALKYHEKMADLEDSHWFSKFLSRLVFSILSVVIEPECSEIESSLNISATNF